MLEVEKLWKSLVKQGVRWAGRFSWSDAPAASGTLEGLIVLKAGAAPHHLAEEHFHHQFGRAELRTLKDVAYPLKHEVPRIADTEGYAGVMAHRFITRDAELAEWEWNGHADLANAYKHLSNADVLALGLTRGFDLNLIASASSRLSANDHLPERPARNKDRLADPELEGVGISRTSQAGLWDWDAARALPIAWCAADVAWLRDSRAQ